MKRPQELHDVDGGIECLWTEADADRSEPAHTIMVPSTADQEIVRLKDERDELTETLEKANRRIHRLLGEKNQLAGLLNSRDEQIQHLNRELGGHIFAQKATLGKEKGTSSLQHSLAAAFVTLVDRVRVLFAASPQEIGNGPESGQIVEPEANECMPLVAHRNRGSTQQIVAVLLFGLDKEEIERLLPTIEHDCSARGMMPLCLIDIDAFELLRGHELIFEYLPPPDDRNRFDPTLYWDLYIQRRLAVVRRKWNPVRVVAFGASAMTTLTLWSSSPFEDAPLPTVIGEALTSS